MLHDTTRPSNARLTLRDALTRATPGLAFILLANVSCAAASDSYLGLLQTSARLSNRQEIFYPSVDGQLSVLGVSESLDAAFVPGWPLNKVRRLAQEALAYSKANSNDHSQEGAPELPNIETFTNLSTQDLSDLDVVAAQNSSAEVALENGALLTASDVEAMSDGFRGEDVGPNGTLRAFQGDMVPENEEQLRLYRGAIHGVNEWVAAGRPWSEGIVKYCFANDTAARTRRAFLAARDLYKRALPCLNFVDVGWKSGNSADVAEQQACKESPAIFVTSNPALGCFSYIGMTESPSQQLQLQDPGCTMVGTVIHELGHSLGMAHEQSRPDRDKYVKINYENVRPGQEHNFDIEPGAYTAVEYDYLSIMHYDGYAFSKSPGHPTVERLDGHYELGQRSGLAASDVSQLIAMYLPEVPGCRGTGMAGIGCVNGEGSGLCPPDGSFCPLDSSHCCACGGGTAVQCYLGEECPQFLQANLLQRQWPLLGIIAIGVMLALILCCASMR
mmetsp:Transcript_47950/g.104308  ORF Transcript_47950/g.104308 Transcript_47950/m.104308 type:complete len:502 (-) Transcript_47950:160-1665(-)